MEGAHLNTNGRPNSDGARINLGDGILDGASFGGQATPLTPGVCTFSTGISITNDICFSGSATEIFVIQMAGNLFQAADKNVILEGGALAENMFLADCGQC
jgi:hypothetical protein